MVMDADGFFQLHDMFAWQPIRVCKSMAEDPTEYIVSPKVLKIANCTKSTLKYVPPLF